MTTPRINQCNRNVTMFVFFTGD